ncbi:UNVERIFIED_CONTAM: hypothetical protein FKN15_050684 [Acipenser sinensis]
MGSADWRSTKVIGNQRVILASNNYPEEKQSLLIALPPSSVTQLVSSDEA